LLTRNVDIVLHPRRAVLTAQFTQLQSEIAKIFTVIEKNEQRKAVKRDVRR
jgi:hypothetical protein